MATNKPLPARVPPKTPAYRWADWCPCCGLSLRPWDGCDDAYHQGRDKAERLNTRSITANMGAQSPVDPGGLQAPGSWNRKPSKEAPSS